MIRYLILMMMFLLVGCGGGEDSPLVSVQGKVLFNDQPISKGSITFVREDLQNFYTGNVTEGIYSLGNSDSGEGALPGRYRVAIMAWDAASPEGQTSAMSQQKEAIPRKYFDAKTSGLEVVVPPEGGEFNFELQP